LLSRLFLNEIDTIPTDIDKLWMGIKLDINWRGFSGFLLLFLPVLSLPVAM